MTTKILKSEDPMGVAGVVLPAELTGPALDWVVGHVMGFTDDESLTLRVGPEEEEDPWHPSTDWSQGGPIIEREKLKLRPGGGSDADAWVAASYSGAWCTVGPTPLVAVMRCYVASKLGNQVEIPEELK